MDNEQDMKRKEMTLLQHVAEAHDSEPMEMESGDSPESHSQEQDVSPIPGLDGIISENGDFVPEWYKKFEELHGIEKSLAKFRSPAALARSYAEMEKMRRYPGMDQKDKMVVFRRMVGLPEKREDFILECPDGMPADNWNTNMASDMAGIAYEYGVPPQAMAALSQRYAVEYQKAAAEAQIRLEEQMGAAEESLQQEWGGSYERNMRQAAIMVERLSERAGIDAAELLDDPSFGGNSGFIRLMREVALMVDETPLKGEKREASESADEARRMESDPAHPLHEAYMNVNHPNHKFANEMYDRVIFRRK